jgi:phage shock protein C
MRSPPGFGGPAARQRLYRNREERVVTGLCAGIADYLGIDPWIVRIGMILAMVPFFIQTVAAYFIASALIPERPEGFYGSSEEEAFWRTVSTDPPATLAELRGRFGGLERRLAAMERTVTSSEFRLHRRFRDLGGDADNKGNTRP